MWRSCGSHGSSCTSTRRTPVDTTAPWFQNSRKWWKTTSHATPHAWSLVDFCSTLISDDFRWFQYGTLVQVPATSVLQGLDLANCSDFELGQRLVILDRWAPWWQFDFPKLYWGVLPLIWEQTRTDDMVFMDFHSIYALDYFGLHGCT